MCQTIKLSTYLRNSLYQEDKCEWKAFSAHIQKLVQWATTWAGLPHPLPNILVQSQFPSQQDWTPTELVGAGSSYPCSYETDRICQARMQSNLCHRVWGKEAWEAPEKAGQCQTGTAFTSGLRISHPALLPTNLLGSLELDGQGRCQRHRSPCWMSASISELLIRQRFKMSLSASADNSG